MAFKWESLRTMPSKRVFASPVMAENNMYVIGGCDELGTPIDCFEMFNTRQKKWHRLQNLPTRRASPAVASVGNFIVAVGGVSDNQKPTDAVEIYDIVEKKWTKSLPLSKKLLGISSVVRENKVYLIGGMEENQNSSDMLIELDLENGSFQEFPPMPTKRYATSSFLIDDKLYVLGGRQMKDPITAFEVFDFSTRQWSSLPNIPNARVFAMYTTSDTQIFSIGGLLHPATTGFSDVCEVFDISKGEWKIAPQMPTKRGDFAIAFINNKVLCAGGLGNEGKPLKIVEVYDPATNSWMKLSDMLSCHCSCSYICHDGRMFVCGGLNRGPTNFAEVVEFS